MKRPIITRCPARGAHRAVLAPLAVVFSLGCSAAQTPLAVEMYNPTTRQTLTCSARDQRPGADTLLLTSAVESCARGLEARGFVRK